MSLIRLDTRSLALFRIALAAVLLADLAGRAMNLTAHYSDAGVLPRSALFEWLGLQAWLTPHAWFGASWWPTLLFAIAALAAMALLVGYRTRLAVALSWLLTVSLQARNPVVVHGGDNLLRLLLLWSLLLPLGARWSVDATREPKPPKAVSSAATFGVLVQISLMYWFSGLLKWNPTWLAQASAVDMALHVDYLTTDAGRLLLSLPRLVSALSPVIVWLELIGPTMLWIPWKMGPVRFTLSLAFICFHLVGLDLVFHLGSFPWVAATAWLLVLPTWMWDRLAPARIAGRSLEKALSVLAGRLPAARHTSLRRSSSASTGSIVAVLLILALIWNLQSLDPDERAWMTPPVLQVGSRVIGVDQRWQTFAPTPPKDDGWYVMPARTADGGLIDAWTQSELHWDKPQDVAASFGPKRWNKYLANLSTTDYRFHRPLFGAFLCHSRPHIESFEILFLLERYDAPARAPEPLLLWEQDCTEPA